MKQKYRIHLLILVVVWSFLTFGCILSPAKESSESERRKLTQLPGVTLTSVLSGSFMEKFETYTLDQFPFRDQFRTLKAVTALYGFGQKDNNDIYEVDGYVAKLEYPLNQSSVSYALERMQNIYDTYLKEEEVKVYVSVIPDKGYFLAEENGYPSMDYEALFEQMQEGTEYAETISITKDLTLESYYQTDTHWRQEKLEQVALTLAQSMGTAELLKSDYELENASESFTGVYYGQSALPLKLEKLNYLTNDILEACVVENIEDDSVNGIYNMDKLESKDPYEMFLSGSTSVITIENPNAENDRELVVFRDSFGSSLVPLLAEGYAKITLLDIRYMKSELVGDYVDFDRQDVLFLYSTLLLNASSTMK